MPPRLSRRQQRQIEELEELGSQLGQKDSVDAEQPSAQGVGFSAVSCLIGPRWSSKHLTLDSLLLPQTNIREKRTNKRPNLARK